jgi:hypothetical protein
MKSTNKRKHKRLKIDRSVRVPIQLFPRMPFIGETLPASLVNLSAGGLAFSLETETPKKVPKRGTEIKIHFRLPGKPLQECWGVITHTWESDFGLTMGVKFTRIPAQLKHEFEIMAVDNGTCDTRIEQSRDPWCIPTCSFYDLCRKPIRPNPTDDSPMDRFEISIQSHEKMGTGK